MRFGNRQLQLAVVTAAFVVAGLLAASTAMASVTRYDQDAAGVTYGPSPWSTFSWAAGSLGSYSWGAGSYRYTQLQNASCDFAFNGSGVDYYDSKGTVFGIVQVWVDSEAPATVDLYNAGTIREQLLFRRTGLTPGNHVLHIRNTTTKNPASTAYQIGVDYFLVYAPSTVTATAGTGGSVSPSGAVSVDHNANQTFAIAPNSGYGITDVKVDGASVGAVSSYTFTGVTGPHTIEATFEELPVASTPATSGWSLVLLGFGAVGLVAVATRRRFVK